MECWSTVTTEVEEAGHQEQEMGARIMVRLLGQTVDVWSPPLTSPKLCRVHAFGLAVGGSLFRADTELEGNITSILPFSITIERRLIGR
jgi:hypothetical protein